MSDNTVACILMFVLMSRKRWDHPEGARMVVTSNAEGLLECAVALSEVDRVTDLTIVCDRGYTSLETFLRCT